MSDPRCKCTMSQSAVGDGCRYCQPQEYIDRLEEWLDEERQELDQKQADLDRALARVAELTEMFAQGFDADGDPDEWRERAMKSISGGLPSGNAFIKRQQAYAIEDWLHGDSDMGDLADYATRLRQQADELEGKQ